MREGSTPIRWQYFRIKRKYPQAIAFFRLSDFRETFDENAKLIARELEIVLASSEMGRGCRVPMTGIPYHVRIRILDKGNAAVYAIPD